ncbi:response regulator transcription factor [Paucihalobacter ruber]|uniref:Response regulator transcription factor n=1 Tax=Paucihalobacter ruber TaxID=2567861 RepID=A0A506PI22_9FLAO|nr:LytTR family DNA-binding domain-containing protein [Paucihalobacter ruber]TPV33259.1 response regulator transcription factor [Paucihalobacter ruber]
MTNKPIKCIIVDDEPAAQAVMKHFIGMVDFVEIKAICFNANEAKIALKTHPDTNLIFLDINMPGESGLNFYKQLDNPPELILTTAYPQYAVEAFEINATDYLLKPIAFERFMSALDKVSDKIATPETKLAQHIIIKSNKVIHQVNLEELQMVEAFGDYIKIHTSEKIIVSNNTLTNFLNQLPDYFLRCHKSFVVNKNLINLVEGNTISINHLKIPIGQTYKTKFIERLQPS